VPIKGAGPIDSIPDGAELLMTADHVMRVPVAGTTGTILVGRVECGEVRPGDAVFAAGDQPICRGRVGSVERFCELLPLARRGDEVGVLVYGWAEFPLGDGVRLSILPGPRLAEPGAAADGGGR
jgi:translation elongation factor EF-Tu-like GTPase